jgi:hypothetical protein
MIVSPELEALVCYLNSCGGSDRYESYDATGQPDPSKARAVAERLRAQLGSHIDVIASVNQSGNRVTITLLAEPAAV